MRLYDAVTYSMEAHASVLFDSFGNSRGKEISGDLVFDDGFGDVQSAFENELFQGAVEHQNWKLSLDADAVLSELVAAWRNLSTDVWLEVVLEQRARGIATPKPFVMAQALQRRLVWWGKLVRNEATGYVDYQSFKASNGLLRIPERKVHVGGLEMTFVHWLHVNFARKAESFLDSFRLGFGIHNPSASMLGVLQSLVQTISPTRLYGISDHHLHDIHDFPVDDQGYTTQFELDFSLTNGAASTNRLGNIYIPVWETAHWSALFLKSSDVADKNAGENSLYTRWPTLGDAMVTFCREFFLKFDVELPTLHDVSVLRLALVGTDNLKSDLEQFWNCASRWAFSSIDDFPISITTTPLAESVKYTPAALWIRNIHVEVPTVSDLVDTPADASVSLTEGKDISYKTLFRLIGQSYNKLGALVDDHRGFEFTFYDHDHSPFMFYAKAVAFKRDDATYSYANWNELHVFKNLDLWGGVRAVVEFDHETVGITPFPSGVRSFGYQDWGDFGNLRYFDAAPGLLYQGSEFGRFSVIEISRKPGGDTHIRGIERRVITPASMPEIVVPPPPDPPEIDPPPIITPPPPIATGEPLCGAMALTFAVESSTGCVTKVEYYIDTVLVQTSPGFTNLPSQVVTCPPLFINTTTMTNGPHQICVKVYPCKGDPFMQCWMFLVSNPCSGTKPPLHL